MKTINYEDIHISNVFNEDHRNSTNLIVELQAAPQKGAMINLHCYNKIESYSSNSDDILELKFEPENYFVHHLGIFNNDFLFWSENNFNKEALFRIPVCPSNMSKYQLSGVTLFLYSDFKPYLERTLGSFQENNDKTIQSYLIDNERQMDLVLQKLYSSVGIANVNRSSIRSVIECTNYENYLH